MERILIVGAGPAGMSAALFLAKKGIPSTLIEKGTFPRDKICGDGLSGWVITMLRRIDPNLLKKLQDHPQQLPSHGVRFFSPNFRSLAIPYIAAKYPNDPPGHVMRRIDFDQILIDEIRSNELIRLVEGVSIDNLDISNNKVTLTDKTGTICFEGDLFVAACGAGSRLIRKMAPLEQEPRHHATGIRQYYEGVTGAEQGNFVDFFFLKKFLPGYLWIFPLPGGHANVGAGIRTDILKKRRLNLKALMEEAIRENPHLAERFKNARPVSGVSAWDLPLGSKKIPLSGNRFILTGDSAFLIDPFTGEGVGNAMWSGYAAAEHIQKALAANRFDASFNRQYDRFVYKKLWKELRISTSIQRLISYRRLFNFVMSKATGSAYLKQSITRMIDDLDERKKLRNPYWYLRILLGK